MSYLRFGVDDWTHFDVETVEVLDGPDIRGDYKRCRFVRFSMRKGHEIGFSVDLRSTPAIELGTLLGEAGEECKAVVPCTRGGEMVVDKEGVENDK